MTLHSDADDPSYVHPARNAATRILNRHWDFRLPIRPWDLAFAMGIALRPRGGPKDPDFPYCGYFKFENGWPVIEYNVTESLNGKRFTIAHELGHFALGHTDAPIDRRGFFADDKDPRERAANRFALELLIPARVLREQVRMCKLKSLEACAHAFQVNAHAIALRMNQVDFGD